MLGLPRRAWVKKTFHRVEAHWLSSKEKFRAKQSAKKVMLTVFWNMNGAIAINFLEKGSTVNSAFYCQVLWQNSPLFIEWHKWIRTQTHTQTQTRTYICIINNKAFCYIHK